MSDLKKQRLLLWAIYLLSGAVSYFSGPGPVLSGDSGGYKSELLKHDWERVLSSFSGRTTRPWPIVAVYEAIGSIEIIVLLQFLILLAAGSFWLYRVTRLELSIGAERICLLASVVILGSPFVWTFAFQILSEALTLSFALVALSLVLGLMEKQNHTRWTLFHGTVLISSTLRPQFLLVWIPIYALLILRTVRISRVRTILQMALALGVITAVLGWWSQNADYWREGIPREAVSAAYYLSENSPISSQVFDEMSVSRTIPACISLSEVLSDDPSEIWTWLSKVRDCPSGKVWAIDFSERYTRHLVARPELLWKYLVWSVPRTFGNPDISSPQVSVIPKFLTDTLMGSSSTGQIGGTRLAANNLEPKVFYDALILGFILSLAYRAAAKRLRLSDAEMRDVPYQYILLAVGLLIVGTFGSLAMTSTDLEMARLGLPSNILFRLVVVLMICFQANEIIRRKKQL